MTYLEDLIVGTVRHFGHYEVTEDEIIAFARRYDDQTFHTDPVAAKDSIFGGLIASGWHVCAMFMRMACDANASNADASNADASDTNTGGTNTSDNGAGENKMASLGSPGFDDLKWLVPVRPGDVLSARTELLSAVPSRGKTDRGTVSTKVQVLNQSGKVVLEMTSMGRFLRRPAHPGA
ncbi:MAG: MaoC family dehydratase [Alphaproteobacteria bacterium]